MSSNTLLLIDPQNDFCDVPGAALPVPGANADLHRVADFVREAQRALGSIVVTLDSHATVGIERTTFWKDSAGRPIAPFTEVIEEAVRAGRYLPRNDALRQEVLDYLHALEGGGRYRLMVWPVHCVLGTWGHNIHPELAATIAAWEECVQRNADKVLKGLNPLTEQYSAIRAEVPRTDDLRTHTNTALIDRARPAQSGTLFVAGEASSHCVAATMSDILAALTPEERLRVVLLTDGMSPVSGFESAAQAFLAQVQTQGVRVATTAQALREIV